MKQIPNIEEMSERFKKEFLAEGSECTWKDYPLATDVLDWVKLQERTHHQQLQKAREEERENINNWAQYTFAYQPSVLKEWEAMYCRMTHPDENPNHSELDQDKV